MSEKKKKSIGKNVGVAADKFSVISVDGEITKPASVLLEKLSAGIGEAYAPWGKVRHAKADAEVARIENQVLAENNELMERAARRAVGEYMREQKNIEAIAAKAMKRLPPDTPEETVRGMDEDKVAFMRNLFKTVSDDEMQNLWADILAGEAGAPGAFSKNTVALVGMMGKDDAEMFRGFCQFAWNDPGQGAWPLIYNWDDEVYNDSGVPGQAIPVQRNMFNVVEHLDALGLISYVVSEDRLLVSAINLVLWSYHGRRAFLTIPPSKEGGPMKYGMKTGKVYFTKAGQQLYRICGARKNPIFFDYIFGKWKELGYNPRIVVPDTGEKGAGE